MDRDPLTSKVIGCAMRVHAALGPGFLESVYQKALAIELAKSSIKFELEKRIAVLYDGINVGDFIADVLVEDRLILELKSVQALAQAHEVQLVHYLTATEIEIGLLLNFGSASLDVKRKFRTYRPPQSCKIV